MPVGQSQVGCIVNQPRHRADTGHFNSARQARIVAGSACHLCTAAMAPCGSKFQLSSHRSPEINRWARTYIHTYDTQVVSAKKKKKVISFIHSDGWMDGWMDGGRNGMVVSQINQPTAHIHTYIHTWIYTYIHTCQPASSLTSSVNRRFPVLGHIRPCRKRVFVVLGNLEKKGGGVSYHTYIRQGKHDTASQLQTIFLSPAVRWSGSQSSIEGWRPMWRELFRWQGP